MKQARQTPLTPVIPCVASPVAAGFVVICAQRESEETQLVTYVSRASEALSNAPFGCISSCVSLLELYEG